MTIETRGAGAAPAPAEVEVQIVDTDVHPDPRSMAELREYLPAPWNREVWADRIFDASFVAVSPLYVAPGNARRQDAFPPTGGPPASDPAFAEQQLFHDAGIDLAMLIPIGGRPMTNPRHEAAVMAAVNNWLAETWLSRYNGYGRYFGTLRICSSDPDQAVREIEKWGGHPFFRQVMFDPYVAAPYGQERYRKIFEAAARHNLVGCMHVGVRRPGTGLLTAVGYVSYFFEYHALYPLLFGTHLLSMVTEGVFEQFPSLKFAFIEGGFSWLMPLLWRLDKHWSELRSEVPHLKRRPSEYVREQVRFTSQPIEEPWNPEDLTRVFDWMDAEHLVMFATDYPHWDGDYDPKHMFTRLPKHVRQRILRDNAIELYGLPRTRRA
ncbi:MAG: amidohydrolase [Chloroflexi bacterium]|nr:amidohydrolase [Chloroflexota bacterium]